MIKLAVFNDQSCDANRVDSLDWNVISQARLSRL